MKSKTHVRGALRRKIIAVNFALALSALLAAGAASPASADEVEASAYPSGCSYSVAGSWGGQAACSQHNGGSYRAWVHCRHTDGTLMNYPGFWTQGGWSLAYCQGDSRALSAGIEYSSTNRS